MDSSETSSSRVWFITGCSRGFGRAYAEAALEQGDRVIATSRDLGPLEPLRQRYPETCRTFALDVTDASQVSEVVKQANASFGRLDVVINNAGYALAGAFEELAPGQIQRNFDINFFGVLSILRAALPILRQQGSGHLIVMSAAAAIGNYPGLSIYGATKWALEGFCESLAQEVKPLGIKVTLVEPGPFRTGFIKRSLEKAESHLSEYDRTSGKLVRFLASTDGRQSGDPLLAARAILKVVASEHPPFRLVLGKYATDKARKKLAATEKELNQWQELGLTTDLA